jgi:hypothetical protein
MVQAASPPPLSIEAYPSGVLTPQPSEPYHFEPLSPLMSKKLN